MQPYMIGKDFAGSYQKTFDYSLEIFRAKDPLQMAHHSGSVFDPERSVISLQSMGQPVEVQFPGGRINFTGSGHSPVWSWRLLILNYLCRADNAPLSNQLISYRELENGHVFYPAFLRESIQPLAKKFSLEPAGNIKRAGLELAALFEEKADICAIFDFLPRFPVTVKIWLKDEEIPGSANILFDAAANHYLHTEDIAVVGNLVSYFWIKQYELMSE